MVEDDNHSAQAAELLRRVTVSFSILSVNHRFFTLVLGLFSYKSCWIFDLCFCFRKDHYVGQKERRKVIIYLFNLKLDSLVTRFQDS